MLDLQFPGDIGQPAGPARPDIFFRAAEVFEGLVGERLVVDRKVGEPRDHVVVGLPGMGFQPVQPLLGPLADPDHGRRCHIPSSAAVHDTFIREVHGVPAGPATPLLGERCRTPDSIRNASGTHGRNDLAHWMYLPGNLWRRRGRVRRQSLRAKDRHLDANARQR